MDDYTFQQELESLAANAQLPLPSPTHDDDATSSSPSSTNPPSSSTKPEPIRLTVARWRDLFPFPAPHGPDTVEDLILEAIQSHRQDLTRPRVSDAHWETVRGEREAAGYDREAYEYELGLQKRKADLARAGTVAGTVGAGAGAGAGDEAGTGGREAGGEGQITYLVELTGLLDDVEKVRKAAGLEGTPAVVHGRSVEEGRAVSLCCVDAGARAAILEWAAGEGGGWEPTILVDPRSFP